MPQESSKVLIFTTKDWVGIARLPMAMSEAGFRVSALCRSGGLLSHSAHCELKFSLPAERQGRQILAAVVDAMDKWKPDFIIPGDDGAVQFLQGLVQRSSAGTLRGIAPGLLDVTGRSLGDPAYFSVTSSKPGTQKTARDLNIPTPADIPVKTLSGALQFAGEHGYPVVLKQAVGYAGTGVRICRNEDELRVALQDLRKRFSYARGIVRRLLGARLESYWFNADDSLTVQEFVRGIPAMFNVVAIRGKTLAGFLALKEQIFPPPAGPSSVVRFVDRPDIAAAVGALIERFGYTGFGSFDFILQEQTGKPFLLEFNARPTPATHLGKYNGTDLCGALFDALNGTDFVEKATARREPVIALFPQEYLRDAHSAYISTAFHDVPWSDPGLLRAYCDRFHLDSFVSRLNAHGDS